MYHTASAPVAETGQVSQRRRCDGTGLHYPQSGGGSLPTRRPLLQAQKNGAGLGQVPDQKVD